MDDVKKEIRKEQIKAGFGNPIDDDGGDSSDSDEDKYVDKMDMPGKFFHIFDRDRERFIALADATMFFQKKITFFSLQTYEKRLKKVCNSFSHEIQETKG